MVALRLVPTLGLLLLLHGTAGAACSSDTCTDLPAIENVRAVVSAACDCSGAASHGKYVRCAKQVVKQAITAGTLAKSCKKPVLRCEARSTCGKARSKICCVTSSKGKVKALTVRGDRCPRQGQLCDHPMALADACTAEGACTKRKGIRSFRSVQRVLQTSCALPTCHSTFQRQGDLVLETEDVSYKSLVNRPAALPEAAGLVRVVPGDPAASFLVRKLRGQGPGTDMPQSGGPLAEPIIQMIEDWIARGAKSTAEECAAPSPGAESLCDDEGSVGGDYHWEPLPPLEAPAIQDGLQLYLPPRPVASGTEWETCYAFRPGLDMPTWESISQTLGLQPGEWPKISNQVYRMHPGSHHLLLYAYTGSYPDKWASGYFPCQAANCVNPSDCPPDADGVDDPNIPGNEDQFSIVLPIGGTQVAGTRYEVNYPDGVVVPIFGANTVLIVNPHYTNPFQPAQDIYGEAWLNLTWYKGTLNPPVVLDGIFAINARDLFVEPFTSRTISAVWRPCSILGCSGGPVDAAVFQLFGHMHKRGVEFQIDYVSGGKCGNGRPCGRDSDCGNGTCTRVPGAEDTTIYYTTSWDQAPIVDFPYPYFPLGGEDGLRWTCTHTNGVQGDPARPPKTCDEGCDVCGWDPPSRTCKLCRTQTRTGIRWDETQQSCVDFGGNPVADVPTVYAEGQPMPLQFGLLAGDDMCNMFGYWIPQTELARLPVP